MEKWTEFIFDARGVETVVELKLLEAIFPKLLEGLESFQHEALESLKVDYAGSTDEEIDEFFSMRSAYERYHENEIQIVRSTQIIRLYMLFESHLLRICGAIQKKLGLSKGWKDMKGTPVEKAKFYLCREAGLLDLTDPVWTRLKTIQVVRDTLIHSYSSPLAGRQKEEIRKLLGKGIAEGDYGELLILEDFTAQAHATVQEFFKMVFAKLGYRAFEQ